MTHAPILVVNPQTDEREQLIAILNREGYDTIGVASTSAALARAGRLRVALVVLDLPDNSDAWVALDSLRNA